MCMKGPRVVDMFVLLIGAYLIVKTNCSPQFYVDESGPWNEYQNRYKPFEMPGRQVQVQPYYPPAPGAGTIQQSPTLTTVPQYYQQVYSNSVAGGPWGQQQTPPSSLSPTSIDALLTRPILVLDSQVFAMYNLIKCWETQGDLKKCTNLIEKCDEAFKKKKKKKNDDSDESDDGDKKKRKRNKSRKNKQKRRDRNRDEESSPEGDDDEDNDNEDSGEDEDRED